MTEIHGGFCPKLEPWTTEDMRFDEEEDTIMKVSTHTNMKHGNESRNKFATNYCERRGKCVHAHCCITIPSKRCSVYFSVRCMQHFPVSRIHFENAD